MSAVRATNAQRAFILTAAFMLVALGGVIGVRPAQAAPASSAKSVKASDYDEDIADAPFPDLAVTVSQTTDLVQQGITVSWSGGKQSTVPNAQIGGTNFLQIMQCWGDDPSSNGTRPDRTTCQYGGLSVPSDSRWSARPAGDVVAAEDVAYSAKGIDGFHPDRTAIPFKSYTGVTLASIVDGVAVANAPDLNTNQFFTRYTTNEVSWAGSGADGTGSVSFELQTAQQSPGLGCGTALTAADGSVKGSSCWLVVIPRGEQDPGRPSVTQSGLFWQNWKHHIAVKLQFKPAGLRCAIGAEERQLSGSELVADAVGQWQPKVCNTSGGAVYSLLTGAESDAAAAANGSALAPLALTSKALSADVGKDSLTYAPIALTGVSIGFSIDYQADATNSSVPDSVKGKERQSFSSLKLTPRLLAKLLTASYTDALPNGADKSHLSGVRNVTQDPDFLAINGPDWKYVRLVGPGVGDVLMPLGRSDSARVVWDYLLADADARAFLNSKPDPWGMKVNPYYSMDATVNPTGTALSLPRDDFPKADPTEFPGFENHAFADVVNLVTWRPFTSSLDSGGYLILRGDSQALGDWDASSIPPKYGKAARALVGLQAVMGLTDTSAASKYQIVQASLLNPAGQFVTPTTTALTASANAMTPSSTQKQVVSFDPTSSAAKAADAAYPLAMPVYAAVNPAMNDAAARKDYATFIAYAASEGQTPGAGDGQLPDGYAPIPAAWKTQALAAATLIASGPPPASATPSAPASATATATTAVTAAAAAPQQAAGAAPTSIPPAAADPAADGATAPALSSGKTAEDPKVPALAAVVPVSAAAALAAALAIPPLTRRRRL